MLVQEFLERSAERFPDKTALVCGSERLSYAELDAMANCLARALAAAGVRYGDRVVVCLDNSPEAVVSIFGILKADAVFSVINPTTKTEKLGYILNNCRASALIADGARIEIAREAAREAPSVRCVVFAGDTGAGAELRGNELAWERALSGGNRTRPPRIGIDIDLASLIYTSGTTGNPKGVMMTHQNMVAASTSITTYLENTERDIILNVLPLSFDYGLYQVLMSAQFGGTLVLEKTFLYPYAVINTLKREQVTGFPIVPTMSAILLQLKELENERFDHLRYISNTAAALPVNHIRRLREIFPGVQIFSMYGLTECKRVSYLPPAELERRPSSIGKGMPNEQVYLVDEHDRVVTGEGAVGELVVRGANVMKGYWEKPEETDAVLRPGRHPWEKVLYTGDLFRMDAEGFLYFVSRKDDIIKSRGEKVSPREIENVLYELPEVVEAAVVGIPDDILGQAIKAYVVLREGARLTDKDILRHCARHLEDLLVPKFVEFRDSLPKTSSGKISKQGL
jgi:amino acid adenylation domain-containing protein